MFRYTLYVYLHVPWRPFGSPVHTPPRVYSNTQQIHARRETRARFDPPIR